MTSVCLSVWNLTLVVLFQVPRNLYTDSTKSPINFLILLTQKDFGIMENGEINVQ